MQILLNGKAMSVAENTTAAKLVEQMGLNNQRMAMEVNRNILPRSEYENYIIRQNDSVEIVQAIGGG